MNSFLDKLTTKSNQITDFTNLNNTGTIKSPFLIRFTMYYKLFSILALITHKVDNKKEQCV